MWCCLEAPLGLVTQLLESRDGRGRTRLVSSMQVECWRQEGQAWKEELVQQRKEQGVQQLGLAWQEAGQGQGHGHGPGMGWPGLEDLLLLLLGLLPSFLVERDALAS